jgi:hypothetical protein
MHFCCALVLGAAEPSVLAAATIQGAGSLSGATAITLPSSNIVGTGPVVIGDGITWSSNESNSLFGWTGGYAAGNNNIVPGDPPIIAVNDAYDVGSGGYATMILNFATPTSGFLAELFWTDGEQTNSNSASIAVYDSANTLLEYILLNNNGNGFGLASDYYGFSRATADISYVKLSNSHIGARNLSYVAPDVGAVPEPGTWAMMLIGFGAIGFSMRLKKPARAASTSSH